jgi:dipeptide/tripeptide permease
LLGTLHEKGDARCDGGFNLFYLGINLGAVIGPLTTGLLQTRAGSITASEPPQSAWHSGWRSTWRSGATWARMAAMCQTHCRAVLSAG